jgi:DNA polymerase-3 subunit gamma/tau
MDVVEIDAASNGTVAEVRALKEQVSYQNGSKFKVVLLDEAHSMSREAFNALLKVLEEPPPRTVFILLTTEPGKILETVASRCTQFTFRRIAPEPMVRRMQDVCRSEALIVTPALLEVIAERADGAMRDALMLLDQCAMARVTDPEQFFRLHGETDFAPALVAAVADGDFASMFGQSDRLLSDIGDVSLITGKLVSCLKDVLVILAGGKISSLGLALDARQALARRITARQAVSMLEVLWGMRTRVRLSDARSNLELALTVSVKALGGQIADTAPANGHHPQGAALATLESMVRQATITP